MPAAANSNRKIRDRLVEQAGYALWLLAVQREACGLNNLTHVMQLYRVPNGVAARIAPLAMPNIDLANTIGAGGNAYGAGQQPAGASTMMTRKFHVRIR